MELLEQVRQQRDLATRELERVRAELDQVVADRDRLRALIGRPYIGAWADEVIVEAAHQVARWGAEHDAGKEPADWFWLIGYLAGKALQAVIAGDASTAHHHTVSTGAVLAQWAAAISGVERVMRPGLGQEALAKLHEPISAELERCADSLLAGLESDHERAAVELRCPGCGTPFAAWVTEGMVRRGLVGSRCSNCRGAAAPAVESPEPQWQSDLKRVLSGQRPPGSEPR